LQAPDYYDEIQAHIQAQLMGELTGTKTATSPNDFWWDLGGWAVLGVVIFGTLLLAKSSMKASPQA
jgi:hypothetical protein